jgi:hypothetical protein
MKHCKRGALRFRGYRIKRLPESDESEEKGLVKSIEEEDRKVRSRKLVLKSGGLTP